MSANSYLLAELVGLAPLLVIMYLVSSRMSAILAGLVLVPFFPLALLHEGAYWTPVRAGGLVLGIEDIAYLFMSGATAYAVALLLGRFPVFDLRNWRSVLSRISTLVLLGAAVLLVMMQFGLDGFRSSLAAAGLFLVGGSLLRPSRALRAIFSGVICAFLHIGNVAVVMVFAPDFAQAFQAEGSGQIYLQEGAFQSAFTAAHILLFSWAIEGKMTSGPDPQRNP